MYVPWEVHTYPMGSMYKAPMSFRPTVPAPNPNSGPAGFLLGSSEAVGLNTDPEIAVQIGMSVGYRASLGD